MSDTERTFVAVKPDGVARGLIGEVISRLEDLGLTLVGAKFTTIDRETAEEHYAEHREKPFFEDLVGFITSGPVMAMVWEGNDAVRQVRKAMGATSGLEAEPGTIRGDFGLDLQNNLVHGSDHEDPGSNEREIELFFDEEELVEWSRPDAGWITND